MDNPNMYAAYELWVASLRLVQIPLEISSGMHPVTYAWYQTLFAPHLRKKQKPEFGLKETVIDGESVSVTEEIVVDKPFCKLTHFKRATKRKDPAVLVVAPLSGHHATLLRDTVRAMLPDFDVYITTWVDAKLIPMSSGSFHLDDYVRYVQEFIRFLGGGVNVVAVCQPTVPVLAAVSLMAEEKDPAIVRTMIMMGGPIDTRQSPTVVNDFGKNQQPGYFERRVVQEVPFGYPGHRRLVCPGFLMGLSFVGMNPSLHLDRHTKNFYDLYSWWGDTDASKSHDLFYDEYNATLDMPAEYYLDTIKVVFQEHHLPLGNMRVGGKRVKPSAINTTALFTIEGELDDISGIGQTEAAHGLCVNIPKGMRQHLVAEGAGHYGIFNGRRYRETIYPAIRDFIKRHTTQ